MAHCQYRICGWCGCPLGFVSGGQRASSEVRLWITRQCHERRFSGSRRSTILSSLSQDFTPKYVGCGVRVSFSRFASDHITSTEIVFLKSRNLTLAGIPFCCRSLPWLLGHGLLHATLLAASVGVARSRVAKCFGTFGGGPRSGEPKPGGRLP